MPFSLYGALPQPKSDSDEAKAASDLPKSQPQPKVPIAGLYASLAPPEIPTTPLPVTDTLSTPTPVSNAAPKPAGWSSFGHFRPVMRKPTVQAKPKLNKPVIPAGAKIVSTTTVQKETTVSASKPITTANTTAPFVPLTMSAVPYLTSSEDVNGFRTVQPPKKKSKYKGNQNPQPVVFDMYEDYDPYRPNDYEYYKEERRQHIEKLKKQQKEMLTQRQPKRVRSKSLSSCSEDSRTYSRSRSRSPLKKHGNAFAPPASLYQMVKRSPSPSPPPSFSSATMSAAAAAASSSATTVPTTNNDVAATAAATAASRVAVDPTSVLTVPLPTTTHSTEGSMAMDHGRRMDLNESADDAYMRRARLSQRAPVLEDSSPVVPVPSLGSGEGMARKMLAKYGWQEGQGLGKSEDGIREALQVQATGRGSGVIINHPPDPLLTKPSTKSVQQSQVILLTNMVGPGEVDDMLQQETADECSKYGTVERCLIFEVPNGQIAEDKAVRIFIKFVHIEAAQRAISDLDGRYFGGRVVSATFYESERFDRIDLAPTAEEYLAAT
ncbi:hypothetical protein BDF14DRAFT_1884980 [Spinellus fusiger]|nr:hypothetical protein BDF14DRAFT_1884980 [Spinellus fusiger]